MSQSQSGTSTAGIIYCIALVLALLGVVTYVAWSLENVALFILLAVLGMVAMSPVAMAMLTHKTMPTDDPQAADDGPLRESELADREG